MTDHHRVFWLDEDYDRSHASNGRSRYGSYLYSRSHLFHDDDQPTDPHRFAILAFDIASPPVMAPGFVCHHPRVLHVAWPRDDEDRWACEIQLIAPRPAVIERALRGRYWTDWQPRWDRRGWYPPYDNDRPAAHTVTILRIPLPAEILPAPAYQPDGTPDVATAQQACRVLCEHINAGLVDILTALDPASSGAADRW